MKEEEKKVKKVVIEDKKGNKKVVYEFLGDDKLLSLKEWVEVKK